MHTKQNGPWPHFVTLGALGGPRQIEHRHSSSSSFSASWLALPESPRPPTSPAVALNSAAEETSLFERSTVLDVTVGCFSTAVAAAAAAAAAAAGRRFALPHPICSTVGFRSKRIILGLVLASVSAAPVASAAATASAAAAAADGAADDCACWRPSHTTTWELWSAGGVNPLRRAYNRFSEGKQLGLRVGASAVLIVNGVLRMKCLVTPLHNEK